MYLVLIAIDPFPLVIAVGSVVAIVDDLFRKKEKLLLVSEPQVATSDDLVEATPVVRYEVSNSDEERVAEEFPLSDEEKRRNEELDKMKREFVRCKPPLPLVCSSRVLCRVHLPDGYDDEYAEFELSTKRLVSFLKSTDRPKYYHNLEKTMKWLEGFDEEKDVVTDVSVINIGNYWGGSMFDFLLNRWREKKLQMRCSKCGKGYSFGKIKIREINSGHVFEEIKCPKGHLLRHHMIEHVF